MGGQGLKSKAAVPEWMNSGIAKEKAPPARPREVLGDERVTALSLVGFYLMWQSRASRYTYTGNLSSAILRAALRDRPFSWTNR